MSDRRPSHPQAPSTPPQEQQRRQSPFRSPGPQLAPSSSSSTPSHSRTPSSSDSSRPRSSSRTYQTPPQHHSRTEGQRVPSADVLTAGDGLASHLGLSPSSSPALLSAQARARRRSSPDAASGLSGSSANERSEAAAAGLTGFDPAKGYQDSGSGGVFSASGGLEPVPMNAPTLMYSGGAK